MPQYKIVVLADPQHNCNEFVAAVNGGEDNTHTWAKACAIWHAGPLAAACCLGFTYAVREA